MYNLIVFLHIFSVFIFLLLHGIPTAVMWQLRNEQDPKRIRTLFDLNPGTRISRLSIAIVVITGVTAGFIGNWWGQGWIWASLVVLTVIWIVMWRYGGSYFDLYTRASQHAVEEGNSKSVQDEFAAAHAAPQPIVVTAVGIAGLAIILWLMVIKPF